MALSSQSVMGLGVVFLCFLVLGVRNSSIYGFIVLIKFGEFRPLIALHVFSVMPRRLHLHVR